MLMDEPFANLDLATRQQLLTEVRTVLEETDTTTILVSHDFYEISRLCSKAVALFEGSVLEEGPPRGLLMQSTQPRVQSFLDPWKELLVEEPSEVPRRSGPERRVSSE
jgi:tungstate transport system ATP-binding protein